MKIKEIIKVIEDFAPISFGEDYDNSGMQIGNSENEVTKVLLTLDITEEVLDEALKIGCNLIISHHPIIFSGIKKITGKNYVEKCIIKAIKNDLTIYSSHTNLDNIFDGVNKKISEKLDLQNLEILELKNYNNSIGSGMIGNLKNKIKTEEFLKVVKEKFKCEMICHTKINKEFIEKVAFAGGSGSFLLENAKNKKADIFITADFKYHQFFDAEDEIIICDIGHFESEQFTSEIFEEILKTNFPNISIYISKINTNPVKYF